MPERYDTDWDRFTPMLRYSLIDSASLSSIFCSLLTVCLIFIYRDDCTVFVFAENPEIAFDADWVYSINKQTNASMVRFGLIS